MWNNYGNAAKRKQTMDTSPMMTLQYSQLFSTHCSSNCQIQPLPSGHNSRFASAWDTFTGRHWGPPSAITPPSPPPPCPQTVGPPVSRSGTQSPTFSGHSGLPPSAVSLTTPGDRMIRFSLVDATEIPAHEFVPRSKQRVPVYVSTE